VSRLDAIVEELKALPPERFELAAEFIHGLKTIDRAERKAILRSTAGILAGEVGEEFSRHIKEGCEQVDERDW
jgi:hypothetical protein